MEFIGEDDIKRLINPGVVSEQLLSPHNSTSERITITRVTLQPGAEQPRHHHATSEQVWVAMSGVGKLLLAHGTERLFRAGDIARFADGDIHGFRNTSTEPFVYMSVTSPPVDFRVAYREMR